MRARHLLMVNESHGVCHSLSPLIVDFVRQISSRAETCALTDVGALRVNARMVERTRRSSSSSHCVSPSRMAPTRPGRWSADGPRTSPERERSHFFQGTVKVLLDKSELSTCSYPRPLFTLDSSATLAPPGASSSLPRASCAMRAALRSPASAASPMACVSAWTNLSRGLGGDSGGFTTVLQSNGTW